MPWIAFNDAKENCTHRFPTTEGAVQFRRKTSTGYCRLNLPTPKGSIRDYLANPHSKLGRSLRSNSALASDASQGLDLSPSPPTQYKIFLGTKMITMGKTDHKVLESLLQGAFLSHVMISYLMVFCSTRYLYFPLRAKLRSVFRAQLRLLTFMKLSEESVLWPVFQTTPSLKLGDR